MAAGEYVSVSSQSDSEGADIGRERRELSENRGDEQQELARIYIERGLDGALATQVAEQLMARDALGAHAATNWGYPRRPERGRPRRLSPLAQRSRSAQPSATGRHCNSRRNDGSSGHDRVPALSRPPRRCRRQNGRFQYVEGGYPCSFWGALAMAVTAGIGPSSARWSNISKAHTDYPNIEAKPESRKQRYFKEPRKMMELSRVRLSPSQASP